jgi:lysophospholipase L1-like esterase
MNKTERKTSYYLGIILIASGILFNKWFIEFTLVPDKNIETSSYDFIIVLFQILSIGFGAYLFMRQPTIRIPSKRQLLLACTIFIITLFVLETGARVWLNFLATSEQRQRHALYSDLSPEESPWKAHHYLNYYPTPNYKLGPTSHNSLGFRNNEFSLKKPDNVYRIAVLGGSTVYTVKVRDNEKTFTAQLANVLRTRYGYKHLEVINAGFSGYSSWESLINFEFRVLDLAPDLVIVYPGADDVHNRLVSPLAYRGDNGGKRKHMEPPAIPFFERSSFLRILGRYLKKTSQASINSFFNSSTYEGACSANYNQDASDALAKELLRQNPPVYFQRNMLNMAAIAEMHNIKILFTTWAYSTYFNCYAATPHYQQGFAENNSIVRELADSKGIPLFDFAEVMAQDKKYWDDGRHVNEEGALLKAKLFADFLHNSGLISR